MVETLRKFLRAVNLLGWLVIDLTPMFRGEKRSIIKRMRLHGMVPPRLAMGGGPKKRIADDAPHLREIYEQDGIASRIDLVRLNLLFTQARRVVDTGVPGEIAELGVYQGHTARLFCLLCNDRQIHLFDTFEGQPQNATAEMDGADYVRHIRDVRRLDNTSTDIVRRNIGPCPGVVFHKGCFPGTAAAVQDVRFALVHLDADQYQSTRDGLEFFYPRLNPRGALICHDYGIYEGVRKAVDAYFADRLETPVEYADQCGSVVVIKSAGAT
jgi:O-methyltransferase